MLHPDMATLLAFITTDAPIDATLLQPVLSRVTDSTFNCVTVDGDTSTNDSCILLANGAAGGATFADGVERGSPHFEAALLQVCDSLAEQLVADAEGATRHFRVAVNGAADAGSGARRRARGRAELAREDRHPRWRPQLGPHRRRARPQRRDLHPRPLPCRHRRPRRLRSRRSRTGRRASESARRSRIRVSTSSSTSVPATGPVMRGAATSPPTTCASTPTTPPDTEQPPQPPCLNRPSTSGSIVPRCSSRHSPTSSGSPATSSSSRSAVPRAPRPTSMRCSRTSCCCASSACDR